MLESAYFLEPFAMTTTPVQRPVRNGFTTAMDAVVN